LEYATVTHKKACRWNAPGLLAVTGYARAGNQLEMAEMDILSTRSAIEKALQEGRQRLQPEERTAARGSTGWSTRRPADRHRLTTRLNLVLIAHQFRGDVSVSCRW